MTWNSPRLVLPTPDDACGPRDEVLVLTAYETYELLHWAWVEGSTVIAWARIEPVPVLFEGRDMMGDGVDVDCEPARDQRRLFLSSGGSSG